MRWGQAGTAAVYGGACEVLRGGLSVCTFISSRLLSRPVRWHRFLSVKQSTGHYMVRLPCVLLLIHKLSETVLHSDLFMLLYEPGKCLKLVDVSVIFLLHIP